MFTKAAWGSESQRIKMNQNRLGLRPKNRYQQQRQETEGDKGREAKTTVPDGKDAGWGESGVRKDLRIIAETPSRPSLTLWTLGLLDFLEGQG